MLIILLYIVMTPRSRVTLEAHEVGRPSLQTPPAMQRKISFNIDSGFFESNLEENWEIETYGCGTEDLLSVI